MKTNTKIAVSIIISVFLIGIVSAGLIDYFGRITGGVEVSAPVFYATSNKIDDRTELRGLWINKLDPNSTYTYFEDGDYRGFATISLGINSIYDAEYNFKFEARTNNASQQIEVRLVTYDAKPQTNNPYGEEICREIIDLTSEDYKLYEFSCYPGPISLSESDGFYWEFKGWNINTDVKFYIKLSGGVTNFSINPV